MSVSVGTVPSLSASVTRPSDVRAELHTVSSGGTLDHSVLQNRDRADQHPIASITNLQETLDSKLGPENALSNAQIQTILGW